MIGIPQICSGFDPILDFRRRSFKVRRLSANRLKAQGKAEPRRSRGGAERPFAGTGAR
jgi:hypothetical protein